eukprot:TRINITY_DN4564_c0_g3_i1.p1 TRINITY_DN4564_c0_g3~~TRINITY_DN4564_c0_g3_i1.p1  ORF type:complete len:408 (+),score=85.09 TRINITY_DN4564_c0_g3_i1:46-1224(+)
MKTTFCISLMAITVGGQPPLADQYGYQSPDGSRTSPDGVTVPYYPGVPTPPPAVKYTSPLVPPSSYTPYRQNGGIDGPYAVGNPNYVYPPPPVPVPGVVVDNNGNIIACSRDVTRCADGTYVGRNRDNGCQFFYCPTGYWPGYSDGYSPPATASPPPSIFQPQPPVPSSPQGGFQPPYVATPQPNPWNRTPKPFVWQTPQPTLRGITPPIPNPVPTNGRVPNPPPVPFVPPTPAGNGGGNVPWNPPPTPLPTQWGSGQFVPPPPRTPEPQGLPVFSPVLTSPATGSPPAAATTVADDDDDDGKTAFIIGMVLLVVLILIAIFAVVYLCLKAKSDKKKAARKQAEREREVAKAVTGISPPPQPKSLVHHPQFNYPYQNYPIAQPGVEHPPPYY